MINFWLYWGKNYIYIV